MLSVDIAYRTLWILVGILGLTFFFLLAYTFWTRAKNAYWRRYRKKFRDYFLPMLFNFVEGDPGPAEADKLISRLTKRTQDILFFLKLLKEMTEILKGEGREKLTLLIEHDMFYDFYRKKLFSYFTKNKLLACLYFEYSNSINDRIIARLITISKSENLKLAYGASKALQSSENLIVRRNAVIRFLKRNDTSDLMVSEILHYFHREGLKQQEEIAGAIKEILCKGGIAPERKKIVVLYLAYHNFYRQSDFLLEFLKKVQYSSKKAPLITGLVEALGQLHVQEAAPIIRQYIEIKDVELRMKCVKALGRLGGKENLIFLTTLILRIEFSVRKAIIEVLAQNSDLGLFLMNRFLIANQKFLSHFKNKNNLPGELKELIQKIHNAVLGIKIVLAKRSSSGHV